MIGAQPDRENHPVAATFFKNVRRNAAANLIVIDPRGSGALRRHASHFLQFKPGSDVALLNALMHVIVEEELYDRQYVSAHTENWFEQLKAHLAGLCARREMAAGLRHRARRAARGRASYTPACRGGDHLLGHGHLPAHPRHRQLRAA